MKIAINDYKVSVENKKWHSLVKDDYLEHFSLYINQLYKIPGVLSPFLHKLGINKENFDIFYKSKLKDFLPDPFYFQNMEKIVLKIADSLQRKIPIGILGDYDVDGASSTAMLHLFFKYCGVKTFIHIPDRFSEGYGPNENALKSLIDKGSKLIILVDCGTTANQILNDFNKRDIDIVIIDHHEPQNNLPKVFGIVNPKIDKLSLDYTYLCAAGMVYIFLIGLNRELINRNYYCNNKIPNLINLLDLVALATVCDVVPLIKLNRVFVKNGLKILRKRKNIGIKVLSDISKLRSKVNLDSLGFFIGPKINAGGRIGDSSLGFKLLIAENEINAKKIAVKLHELNSKRQDISREVEYEAIGVIERNKFSNKFFSTLIFLTQRKWHQGVLGIVAGRLKEKYNLPVFLLTIKKNICIGSVRSPEYIPIGKFIEKAKEQNLLISGGGHDFAGGFSTDLSKIDNLKKFFYREILHFINLNPLSKNFNFLSTISVSGCSYELGNWIEELGPWGGINASPKFLIENAQVKKIVKFGNNKEHVSFIIFDKTGEMKCIKYHIVNSNLHKVISNSHLNHLNFVGQIIADGWNNKKNTFFNLIDIIL